MLYFKTTSKKNLKKAVSLIANGKESITVFCGGIEYVCNETLAVMQESPRPAAHRDSVEIRADMTTAEIKNARRLAAGRRTVRTKEERADAILEKGDAMTAAERLELLALVNVAYHSGGSKIEGIFSIDSCASCDFCQKMIASAAGRPLVICGQCYAERDSYKEFAWRQHSMQARIFASVLFTVDELKALDIPGARCRFNEDGDTVNETMARNYLRIAAGHLSTMFGYWYKNAGAVESGLHAEGIYTREQLPENVRFIHSSVLIGFETSARWFDDAIFTVYPDENSISEAIAAGAHECNGRRCRACGFTCYLMARRPEPLRIAEYLRAGKAARALVMAAYEAEKARRAAL